MAEIKMDVSEYEALKNTIKLLEESKKREEALNDEIKKLQQESIDKLMESEQSVTIINRTFRRETIVNKISNSDVNSVIFKIKDILSRNSRMSSDLLFEELRNSFYRVETIENCEDTHVTTKGFEEVKKEVSEKYWKELSKETNEKLKDNLRLKVDLDVLRLENSTLNKTVIKLSGSEEFCKGLQYEIGKLKEQDEKNKKVLKELNSILKTNWNVFNISSMKDKINYTIKEK